MIELNVGLDLFPLMAALLAAATCALLGNYLVLRRLSLMGDAISHSVLPGLVIAFLLASTRHPLIMFAGAAAAGIATVALVELVKKLGRVEPGAAMGVVFSILFALGVLLIEQAAARHIDLDADCVLHGQLETLVWFGAPESWAELWRWSTLDAVPRQVSTLAAAFVMTIAFITLLSKELRIAAFDPDLASSQGFSAPLLHAALMVFVAIATVASFEAVGSILVIAMLICPAATASLLSDRLNTRLVLSLIISTASGVIGYVAASAVPAAFGKDSVNAAGSITVIAGAMLTVAIILSPRHGLVARLLRRRRLARRVALDDLLAALYRAREAGRDTVEPEGLALMLPSIRLATALAIARRHDLIRRHEDRSVSLTPSGERAAAAVIRSHRLWERYLVDEAGIAPDHVHQSAETLEHAEVGVAEGPTTDPHGRTIPPNKSPS